MENNYLRTLGGPFMGGMLIREGIRFARLNHTIKKFEKGTWTQDQLVTCLYNRLKPKKFPIPETLLAVGAIAFALVNTQLNLIPVEASLALVSATGGALADRLLHFNQVGTMLGMHKTFETDLYEATKIARAARESNLNKQRIRERNPTAIDGFGTLVTALKSKGISNERAEEFRALVTE
ncbi:MAG: hypothetical protein WCP97_07720 [bacterium]